MRYTILLVTLLLSCSSAVPTEKRSATQHGRDLFSDPAASDSSLNRFSCATCHRATSAEAQERVLPGGVLAGASQRPTFWGGQEDDLLRAINHCRYYFMGAQRSWTKEDEQALAMYAWITDLAPEQTKPQAFTLVKAASDLPAGDRSAGAQVYERACRVCHGAAHTAEGKLRAGIPRLPEESVASFRGFGFTPEQVRITFIEKVRHGGFLGLYGNMPPYSTEVLSDADLGALVAFLELYP